MCAPPTENPNHNADDNANQPDQNDNNNTPAGPPNACLLISLQINLAPQQPPI